MKQQLAAVVVLACVLAPRTVRSQDYDIYTFDPFATGPWSDPGRTTLVVPKVANNSVQLDGSVTPAEYGGGEGVTVTPGVNAWILDFPEDRAWAGPDDSSFTFWLAHDDTDFYVGVHVQDDIVNSDDPNAAFGRDDAIEIVVDALNDRFDNNTDNSQDPYGGHSYFNFEGRFSAWDEAGEQIGTMTWANAVEWQYGLTNDVYGAGRMVAGGWEVEVRFSKRLFEDPAAGNRLRDGYRMGFNIGLDDDDRTGTGPNGDASRTQDLEIQYWWANRQRREGWTAELRDSLPPEELQTRNYYLSLFPILDQNGRLAHGGTGEILFGFDIPSSGDILFVVSDANALINADPSLAAWLRAKGYTVTLFTANASTPEDLRAAAEGKDLVLLSESIGSTSVLDPAGDVIGVFTLKDADVPVISLEPFMYDNADWTARTEDGSNNFVDFGNSGRSEVDGIGLGDARDSIYVQDLAHPITEGFDGRLQVYSELYSFNFGIPSEDAEVLASLEEDGSYPTLWIYEEGDRLVDGSVAPNLRIAHFYGQAANPTVNYGPDLNMLNEAGKTLLLRTIEYAIGSPGQVPTLSIARAGNDIVITFAGGALESAENLGGPWNSETGSSPLTIQTSGARKFYRVRG
jgi:hypothetical protein